MRTLCRCASRVRPFRIRRFQSFRYDPNCTEKRSLRHCQVWNKRGLGCVSRHFLSFLSFSSSGLVHPLVSLLLFPVLSSLSLKPQLVRVHALTHSNSTKQATYSWRETTEKWERAEKERRRLRWEWDNRKHSEYDQTRDRQSNQRKGGAELQFNWIIVWVLYDW